MATMRRMIELGREGVAHGQADVKGTLSADVGVHHEEKRTALVDALANMRHWADSELIDWNVAVRSAMDTHYQAEKGTDLDKEADA